MKFVHVADTHFDSPFYFLSNKADLGDVRRLDQRNSFEKMINYIRDNDIEYLFISGDLYEQKSIRESTINYINDLFKSIPKTKVFITPGNHDPFIKNSFYNIYDWADNVKIFGSNIEKVEEDEVNIYGYGLGDFNSSGHEMDDFILDDTSRINVLITHSSLDGDKKHNVYNPISSKVLKSIGFDYVALGDIHKTNLEKSDQIIVYPGSTCSMGFDELGYHGMIVGEINKKNDGSVERKIEFVTLDAREFKKIECKVNDMNTIEDLAQYINQIKYEDNKYYEVVLVGGRNFEINIYKLYKLVEKECVIKIKDATNIGIDLDEIEKEMSLRGLFVKKMREKNDVDDELIEKALEYGLESLMS